LTRQFASNEIVARAHQSNKLNLVPILNVRAQTTFSLDAAVSRDIGTVQDVGPCTGWPELLTASKSHRAPHSGRMHANMESIYIQADGSPQALLWKQLSNVAQASVSCNEVELHHIHVTMRESRRACYHHKCLYDG